MKYNQEIIDEIIRLRESGLTITKIGNTLKIPRKNISDILKENNISTKRNTIKEDIFEKIDNEEKAYWLGFIMADGYISKYNQIEVSIQLSDKEHLKKLKEFVNTNTPIIEDNTKYNRCRLLFCSKKMAGDLAKLGCTNKKSLTLAFPNKEQVPDIFLKDFIRGYVDGDGCICITEKTLAFSITSNDIFIKGMLTRTGWINDECNYYPSGNAITWRCWKKYIIKYLSYLYEGSTIYLERKFEKYKSLLPFK